MKTGAGTWGARNRSENFAPTTVSQYIQGAVANKSQTNRYQFFPGTFCGCALREYHSSAITLNL